MPTISDGYSALVPAYAYVSTRHSTIPPRQYRRAGDRYEESDEECYGSDERCVGRLVAAYAPVSTSTPSRYETPMPVLA
eukprot:2414185-Rhodomonas_salina.1